MNIKHFWTLSYNYWASLDYPVLNFKKMVCPKKVWKRHWTGKVITKVNTENCQISLTKKMQSHCQGELVSDLAI